MKYIYNLTYHIEEEVYPLWQEWITSRLEPLLRQSKCSAAKLLQIHTDALGSKAFGVQYEAEKEEDIVHFQEVVEALHRKELFLQFGEKVLIFGTLLTVEKEWKR